MNTKRIMAALALAALFLDAGSACAGTVAFRVPLDVKNYAGGNALVWCELRSAQNLVLSSNAVHFKIQGGTTSPGTFVEVKVNYTDANAPAVKSYRCALVADQGLFGSGMGAAKAIPASATILSQVTGQFQ